MRDCLFTPTVEAGALFMPPARSRMVLGAAPAWEKAGSRWFPRFAGVVLMEAGKQIYAAGLVTARARRRTVQVPAEMGLPRLTRVLPGQIEPFDRDDFAPRLGALRMAMRGIGKDAQRRLGAKAPGLRWGS